MLSRGAGSARLCGEGDLPHQAALVDERRHPAHPASAAQQLTATRVARTACPTAAPPQPAEPADAPPAPCGRTAETLGRAASIAGSRPSSSCARYRSAMTGWSARAPTSDPSMIGSINRRQRRAGPVDLGAAVIEDLRTSRPAARRTSSSTAGPRSRTGASGSGGREICAASEPAMVTNPASSGSAGGRTGGGPYPPGHPSCDDQPLPASSSSGGCRTRAPRAAATRSPSGLKSMVVAVKTPPKPISMTISGLPKERAG